MGPIVVGPHRNLPHSNQEGEGEEKRRRRRRKRRRRRRRKKRRTAVAKISKHSKICSRVEYSLVVEGLCGIDKAQVPSLVPETSSVQHTKPS